jgi:putative methionine-R-sulfoxide reductase with GAF domain
MVRALVFMSRSQNLVEPLQQVTAPYGFRTARTPARRPSAGFGSGEGLDALVGLSLEQPVTARRLNEAVAALQEAPHLAATLPRILDGAMALIPADFANVQIVDPRDGSLVLVAQTGFGRGFLDHFAVVRDDRSVCGDAAGQGVQTIVTDVRDEPALEPHWATFRVAGVRAVQSTPLVDGAGRLIGMLSTHSSRPLQPSDRDLLVLRLYGRFAGEAVARLLDGTSQAGVPTGRTRPATISAAPALIEAAPVRTDSPTGRIMSETINRLQCAGMSLLDAERLISDRLTAERVHTGLEEIDGAIRAIQSAMLERVTGRTGRPANRHGRGVNGSPR